MGHEDRARVLFKMADLMDERSEDFAMLLRQGNYLDIFDAERSRKSLLHACPALLIPVRNIV